MTLDAARGAALEGWGGAALPERVTVPALPSKRLFAWQRWHIGLVMLADVVCVGAAGTVALLWRFGLSPARLDNAIPYWLLVIVGVLAWVLMAAMSGAYDVHTLDGGTDEHKRVLNTAVRLTAAIGVVGLSTHSEIARGFLLVAIPLGTVATLGGRHISHMLLIRARARGWGTRRVLVVGSQEHAFDLAARLTGADGSGYQVVGVCSPGAQDRRAQGAAARRHERRKADPIPVLGHVEDVELLARSGETDIVAVAQSPGVTPETLRFLGWQLEGTGVEMLVSPGLVDVAGPRIHIAPVAGLPLLHVDKPEFSASRRVIRSAYDRLLALAALVVLTPVLAAVALAIRLEGRGPILFRQRRVGRGGQEFTMLKFRSMQTDAEARLQEVSHRNHHGPDGPLFKDPQDPRVTRVGRFLRRWSLDEIPQFINVLRGEMSLVGPRPPLPNEVASYGRPEIYRRLMVRPGLTGLWQISGRSELSWQETVRLDLYYVENWSPALDASIMWRTAGAVLRRRGAY